MLNSRDYATAVSITLSHVLVNLKVCHRTRLCVTLLDIVAGQIRLTVTRSHVSEE